MPHLKLETVHKRRPQSRGRGLCPVRTFFGQGGGSASDVVVRTFWCKNLGFFEIYGVSARTRGQVDKPVLTFRGQGGVNFLRFCVDVCYGRPLTSMIFGHLPEKWRQVVFPKTILCVRVRASGNTFSGKCSRSTPIQCLATRNQLCCSDNIRLLWKRERFRVGRH